MKTTWIIVLLTLVTISSCKEDKEAKLQKMKADYEKLGIEIKTLETEMKKEGISSETSIAAKLTYFEINKTTFNHYIEVQGRIDGDDNVIATSKAMGVITRIYAKEGDQVKKGQVLAEIEAGMLYQSLEEIKTQLEFVTELYDKQKELWDQKIGSEVQYLSAKNNKESLENRLKTMNEQIDMYKIIAPISGTIEEAPLKTGQNMAPGMIAFRIINFSKVKVISEVSEAYAVKIKKGNPVKISFPDEQKEISAKIDFTGRYINPVNRTFMIETYLKPGEIEFRANMIAVLNILDYTNPDAIVIPINFIQNDSKNQFVWVAEKKGNTYIAKKRTISQGQSYNGLAEIISGLSPGDRVLTSGIYNLQENQTIAL
jgi:RND family efflux transporter MFP subunit